LSRDVILRSPRHFERVKKSGDTYPGRLIVLGVLPAPDGQTRVGVIAAKRTLRRAVDRNRARRLLREAFRLTKGGISNPMWVVLIARYRIIDSNVHDVQTDLLRQLRRAGLTEESQS
jgi:ribonuclease P protein component